MQRHSAIEPVTGHIKAEHRTGRNYLACPAGRPSTILAIAAYNLSLVLSGVHRDEHPRGRSCECIPFVADEKFDALDNESVLVSS